MTFQQTVIIKSITDSIISPVALSTTIRLLPR